MFPVEIEKGKWVADLKKAIKVEKSPCFDHIPADSLVLWKVSIPHDSNPTENINKLTLIDEDGSHQVSMVPPSNEQILSLSTAHKLSKVLSEPPIKEHLHIIVKPSPALLAAEDIDMGGGGNIITALRTSSFVPDINFKYSLTLYRSYRGSQESSKRKDPIGVSQI